MHPLDLLQSFFSEDLQARVLGVTPLVHQRLGAVDSRPDAERAVAIGERQYEVERWMTENAPGERWVALDDDPSLFEPGCRTLVVCVSQVGLTTRELEQSYPEFASRVQKWSQESDENAVQSRREVWRRMAFNAAIANGDDHPRNHGLVRRDGAWQLAPAYDISPPATFSGTLSMAITRDGQSAATRSALLLDCGWFGVELAAANKFTDLAEEAALRVRRLLNGR